MNIAEITHWLRDDAFREAVRKFRQVTSPRSGWAQSGKLITGNQSVASMQATFGKSGTFTIQFNIIRDDVTDVNAICAEAEITWSQSGNFVTRRISVMNGASISGQGEAAKVSVKDVTDVLFGRGYTVTMQVTEGVRASYQQPPILVPRFYSGSIIDLTGVAPTTTFVNSSSAVLQVASQTEVDVDVPQNAGIISVNIVATDQFNNLPVRAPLTDQSLLVQLADASGANRAYNPIPSTWQPTVPGLAHVRLCNFLAGGGAPPIQFSIAYGIDG